jgi:membrane-associated protein
VKIGGFFRIREEKLLQLKQQVSENAGKTVFLGRFLALLRIVASPLAGIAQMPFYKFMAYNLAGATAWASVMVTLSFFAGRLVPLEQLVVWVAQFGVIALFLLISWIVVPLWLESREAKRSIEGD